MDQAPPYSQIPTKWPTVPGHVLRLATQRALVALANDGLRPVGQRLATYYDIDGDDVGASFTELVPNDWHDVTAADLHAVTLLSGKIGARATRRLLVGPERTWVVEALRRLPDRDLFLADPATLDAMLDFHCALMHALSDADIGQSTRRVAASTLAARKRPDLFPILDPVVCGHLGLLQFQDARCGWQVFRSVLQDDNVQRALRAVPDASANAEASRTIVLEPSELRLLDAAVRTYVGWPTA